VSEIHLIDVEQPLSGGFLEYARLHGAQHDDSYLAPEHCVAFDPAREPAVVAVDGEGLVVGAASVMRDLAAGDGMMRFRVLHTLHPEYYPALADRILSRLPEDANRVTVLLPEHAGDVEEALEAAGFGACKRAYVLRHLDPRNAPRLDYPSGTQTRPATPAVATDWANIVNSAMHGQPDHVDTTYSIAGETLGSPRVLGGASLIAYRGGSPAGGVLTVTDAMDPCAAEITMLAVVPSHQGMGLGRALLHDAVATAGRGGCRSVSLAVSTFNRRAVALYLDAGFRAQDVRVCWQRTVSL